MKKNFHLQLSISAPGPIQSAVTGRTTTSITFNHTTTTAFPHDTRFRTELRHRKGWVINRKTNIYNESTTFYNLEACTAYEIAVAAELFGCTGESSTKHDVYTCMFFEFSP